jgi:hypothetical protein
MRLKSNAHLELKDIAKQFNPVIRGWVNYYGRFSRESLIPLARYINEHLRQWAIQNMIHSGHIVPVLTIGFGKFTKRRPGFLLTGMFFDCTDTSRMSREAQDRICEKLGVKFPRAYSAVIMSNNYQVKR